MPSIQRKLRLSPGMDAHIIDKLKQVERIEHLNLTKPSQTMYEDTFYDTPELALLSRGVRCRLRYSGAGTLLLLRGGHGNSLSSLGPVLEDKATTWLAHHVVQLLQADGLLQITEPDLAEESADRVLRAAGLIQICRLSTQRTTRSVAGAKSDTLRIDIDHTRRLQPSGEADLYEVEIKALFTSTGVSVACDRVLELTQFVIDFSRGSLGPTSETKLQWALTLDNDEIMLGDILSSSTWE